MTTKQNETQGTGTSELIRMCKWYNPFTVVVSGKPYELNNIIIFNSNGVLFQTGCGWFDGLMGSNNPTDKLTIKGEIKKKVKEDHTSKNPYIIKDSSYYDRSQPRYILYIPLETLPKYETNYKYIAGGFYHSLEAKIIINFNGLELTARAWLTPEELKNKSKELDQARDNYNEIIKKLDDFKLQTDTDTIKENIKALEKAYKKYADIRATLEGFTVEHFAQCVAEFNNKLREA